MASTDAPTARAFRTRSPATAFCTKSPRAAIQATANDAQQVLVVGAGPGPGPGDELPHLLNACADAAVTVLEPSELMLEQCRKTVADHPGSNRCQLLLSTLDEALQSDLKGAPLNQLVNSSISTTMLMRQ